MALYDFKCEECEKEYDDFARYDESGEYPGVKCPHCNSKKKTKLIPTSFGFSFSQPEGTDKWNSSSTGHDYRFKHNIPKVKAEREMAEKLSHMGSDPYVDTSKEDIELDTGIHDPETRGGLS